MRRKRKQINDSVELVMAVGLVWGHLNARQFEEAYRLAKGCLRLWPDNRSLVLMMAYAAAEELEPLDKEELKKLRDPSTEEWISLVLRRSQIYGGTA
jgi:predicted AlkP superfamily phosphohydrolase/phosphomutase